MIKEYMLKVLGEQQQILKAGLIRNIENKGLSYAFYSVRDGYIKIACVYSKREEKLNIFGLYGEYYTTLLKSIDKTQLNKEIIEVLK